MQRSDELRAQELIEKLNSRTAKMNNHAASAASLISESLRENNELKSDDLSSVKHHLRKYNQEEEKLEDVLIELDQLLNP